MKIRHFAEIHYGSYSESPKTIEMPSRDINDIKIPNHTKYIIVFDKLESEVEYDGNKYTLT